MYKLYFIFHCPPPPPPLQFGVLFIGGAITHSHFCWKFSLLKMKPDLTSAEGIKILLNQTRYQGKRFEYEINELEVRFFVLINASIGKEGLCVAVGK